MAKKVVLAISFSLFVLCFLHCVFRSFSAFIHRSSSDNFHFSFGKKKKCFCHAVIRSSFAFVVDDNRPNWIFLCTFFRASSLRLTQKYIKTMKNLASKRTNKRNERTNVVRAKKMTSNERQKKNCRHWKCTTTELWLDYHNSVRLFAAFALFLARIWLFLPLFQFFLLQFSKFRWQQENRKSAFKFPFWGF